MKLAIHHRENSFSRRWIEYCEINNIQYKIVDCYSNDIFEQLSDCDGLLWHWDLNDYRSALVAKQITKALEIRGIKVFPNLNTSWHFDDKVGQKYIFEAIDAPLVPAHIFYSKTEALNWVESAEFPKVFKLRGGAASINVKLIKNKRQAKKLIKIAFGKGFNIIDRSSRFKNKFIKFIKYPNVDNLLKLIKGLFRFFIITEVEKYSSYQKGYIYFQDFIPGNKYDTRLYVIGDRCFGVRRYNRKNDFRASGSGIVDYNKNLFEEENIKLAFKISDALGSQSMAYDFIKDEGKYKIVEMSYCFPIHSVTDTFEGYWDRELNWHANEVNPQYFIIEDFINKIQKQKTYTREEANLLQALS